jgi:transcriptional regulator with XRE-family HTH domain
MVQTLDLQRFQALPGDALAQLLRKYADKVRFRKNKHQAQIARDSWLDESYVSRLISGERSNPSRDALILLGAFGLELPVHELDEILMAADYKPLVLPASIS